MVPILLDYETLRYIWWVALGILLIGFAIMDGFDMGVAFLNPLIGNTDMERRIILNTIKPVWEGNQVWLILAAGSVFAAFPTIYATAFSSFYIAMLLLLLSLIVRPVSLEFRDKFDISKGNKFSTYAHHYILGRIKRSLEYYNHLIRKPAHINMAETKLNIFDIEQEVTEEDLKKLVTDRFSLNTLKNAWITKKIKIVDLSDFESEQVQDVDNTDVKIAINQMLAMLNDREKKCIELRFGLNGSDQHQYNDIDKIVGCDSEQMISYAFKKLRKSDKILEYMDILKWIH